MFDTQRDGRVSRKELGDMVRSMGANPTDERLFTIADSVVGKE